MLGYSYFLLVAVVVLVILFFYFVPFLLWISARVSGVNISLLQLFLMRIRKVPPQIIVRAMIEAHKAGLKAITRDELEAHYLAGGHVERVVHALVSASKANIDLGFQMATAYSLWHPVKFAGTDATYDKLPRFYRHQDFRILSGG